MGERSVGEDHFSYGQQTEDDDSDAEIYVEMRLKNGQLHKPSGNHQRKISSSLDQRKASQEMRGKKRPYGVSNQYEQNVGCSNVSLPKIACLPVTLNGIEGFIIFPWHLQVDQEEEDPGEDTEPQEEVNKLLEDLDIPNL